MTKMIFGAVVAVGIVSGAVAGAWSYNAVRTTQATVFTPAEAAVAALSAYDLTLLHGKNLPVENWEPAY
jgi:hypothetical protein